jgi:hypothetical protein
MTLNVNNNNNPSIPAISNPIIADQNNFQGNNNVNANNAPNRDLRLNFVNGILSRNAAMNAPGSQGELIHNMRMLQSLGAQPILARGLNSRGNNADGMANQGSVNLGANQNPNVNQTQGQNPPINGQGGSTLSSGNPLGGSSLPPRAGLVVGQNDMVNVNNNMNQMGFNSQNSGDQNVQVIC